MRAGAHGGSFPPSPELGARTRLYRRRQRKRRADLLPPSKSAVMLVSDDEGRHWTPAVAGLDDPDVHQILPSSRTRGFVVAACGEGIYRSLDRGEHWEKVTPSGARDFGSAVTEDGTGAIYLGLALGRPNTWLRKQRADAAIFVSNDGGAHWDSATAALSGGVMAMCPAVGGEGVFASTSEGDVLQVDSSGARKIIGGLPSITALAVGA